MKCEKTNVLELFEQIDFLTPNKKNYKILVSVFWFTLSYRFAGKKYETKQITTKIIVKQFKIKIFDEDQI